MAINSRAKGSRGEKLVIALIRPWWAQLEAEVEFARTPLSGGWQGRGQRGQSLRGEMRMSGDLMTTSHRFPFSVEVKNNTRWTLERIAAGKSSVVWDWWNQTQTAAAECNQVPMLWLRHERKPWKVILPYRYATQVPIEPPLLVWTIRDLLSVDHGAFLPIMFEAATVLAVHPERFALARHKFEKRDECEAD
jgi:hypothetical protein